jgi:hypothetical protein
MPHPELPPLPQACDITPTSWSNLFSTDQMLAWGQEVRRMALEELRSLIADDAYAISFQTFGQYRTALLKAIDATAIRALIEKQRTE